VSAPPKPSRKPVFSAADWASFDEAYDRAKALLRYSVPTKRHLLEQMRKSDDGLPTAILYPDGTFELREPSFWERRILCKISDSFWEDHQFQELGDEFFDLVDKLGISVSPDWFYPTGRMQVIGLDPGEPDEGRLHSGCYFFVARQALDRLYPTGAAQVAEEATDLGIDPASRQPPGKKPKHDWKRKAGWEIVRRLQNNQPMPTAAIEWCQQQWAWEQMNAFALPSTAILSRLIWTACRPNRSAQR
jgi:hypothetical protein